MQELNKLNNGGGEEEKERRRRGTEREGREKGRRQQKRLSRGRDTEVVSITLLFVINYLFTNLCLQCHSLHIRLAFSTPPPLQQQQPQASTDILLPSLLCCCPMHLCLLRSTSSITSSLCMSLFTHHLPNPPPSCIYNPVDTSCTDKTMYILGQFWRFNLNVTPRSQQHLFICHL